MPASGAPVRTFAVRVLGCKVNQYEARQIEAVLSAAGLQAVLDGEAPDLCVVHTCAVTGAALSKSARRARSFTGRARYVLATGCGGADDFETVYPPGVIRIPPGPDWIEDLCAAVETLGLPRPVPAVMRRPGGPGLARFERHARAFLKIQDGCDLGCSYCIVPRLRKGPRDRPLPEIVDEVRRLAAAGHAEIVVTGVSVGLFGREGPASLADVLRAVASTPGVRRVRLSSLHPAELTDDLLAFWADSPRMAPHIHLPLQSGSDAVLARMRRGYTVADMHAAVARARKRLDRPTFSTDVIAGFPGETDEDFERTCALCREVGFIRMHVFPFSVRPGTPAERIRPRVPAAEIRRRADRLGALARERALAAHREAVGRPACVLCEVRGRESGTWSGYSARYIPMRFPGPDEWAGRIVRVIPNDADETGCSSGRNTRGRLESDG